MKRVSSALTSPATGDGWFKVYSQGYNDTTSQWCTETLMSGSNKLSFTVPEDLAGGYYFIRPELLSLQQADKTPPNPQFYVGCAQIFLVSSGTHAPTDTVKIPGYVNITDQSVLFNIFEPKWPYVEPGPKAYVAESSAGNVQPMKTQLEGLLPGNAILENANWWGVNFNAYTTEAGCWNVSLS